MPDPDAPDCLTDDCTGLEPLYTIPKADWLVSSSVEDDPYSTNSCGDIVYEIQPVQTSYWRGCNTQACAVFDDDYNIKIYDGRPGLP